MVYFNVMMKTELSVKETERALAGELRDVLAVVPTVEVRSLDIERPGDAPRVDIIADVSIASRSFTILMEVKSSGQPRVIRSAVDQALQAAANLGMKSIVLVGAPYMADSARRLCDEAGVGWLDLAGNVRIEISARSPLSPSDARSGLEGDGPRRSRASEPGPGQQRAARADRP